MDENKEESKCINDEAVELLKSMGFGINAIKSTLKLCDNDVMKAIDKLLKNSGKNFNDIFANDEKEIESETEDQQEALVNNTDLREPIHELGNKSFRETSIIQCIGQLEMQYIYLQKGNYKVTTKGTGTVIKMKNNGMFSSATAIVLSAAHNVRHTVWECCNQYFEQFDQNRNKITNCKKCLKLLDKNTDTVIIKATSTVFKRRTTSRSGFGTMEQRYDCIIEYLDESNYKHFPYPKSGYDWVLLSFIDKGNYYWENCKNIEIKAVNLIKDPKYTEFMIIGYPGEKKDQMWGMIKKGNTVQYKMSYKTMHFYLMHKDIDATPGQSGSPIVTLKNKKAIIWGIHVGGNQIYKYNIGTIITQNMLYHINNIINGNKKNDALSFSTTEIFDMYKKTMQTIVPFDEIFIQSEFREKGVINPEEFLNAGRQLIWKCPIWSWESGKKKRRKAFLPDNQQYLIARNLPCMSISNTECVVENGEWLICEEYMHNNLYAIPDIEDFVVVSDNEDSANFSIPDIDDFDDNTNVISHDKKNSDNDDNVSLHTIQKTRTYDVSITYDKYYRVPQIWLYGYDVNGNPLNTTEMCEDIADKAVKIEPHIHTGVVCISINPCKHSHVMKCLVQKFAENGKEIRVEDYMFLFIQIMQCVTPSIEYFAPSINLE
eukprot:275996_1